MVTIGLGTLRNAALADNNARRLLTDVLAVQVSNDPTVYATALRQQLGRSADPGGLIEVTVDASAVLIRPTTDLPGLAPLRIVLPSPP